MLSETRQKPEREENLVPLINIVFLMLIFFLMTTALKPFDKQNLEVATASDLKNSKVRRDVILLSADGRIFIDGTSTALDALPAALTPWIGKVTQDKPLLLVADKNSDAQKLVKILQAATSAGVNHIKLVTEIGGGP